MHAAVDVGIARGALDEGAVFLRDRARPWREAGVARAAEDPQLLRLAGELETHVRAAEALLQRPRSPWMSLTPHRATSSW